MTVPRRLHHSLPTEWHEREQLRQTGQFWTPSWVAEAMVAYLLQSAREVFDPAAGRGAFLQAMHTLAQVGTRYYGLDVDPTVLADPVFQQPGVTVEVRDFMAAPPERRFAAIVANPPYIRHHRLPAETKVMLQQRCEEVTGFRLDGRTGYHAYFLVQALHLLQPDGRLAFIVPADTVEGRSAARLWGWITTHYCLDGVVTFESEATPFPGVDTNALVVLLRNSPPQSTFSWAQCHRPDGQALRAWSTGHQIAGVPARLSVQQRTLQEALQTGLSRSQRVVTAQYRLSDFATVMRGIATGANDFFFLTHQQVRTYRLPTTMLHVAVGRTRDVPGDELTLADIERLDRSGRPTQLLSLRPTSELPPAVQSYLAQGVAQGLPQRALLQQRKHWYLMEQRRVPPILFAYLGRRNIRFIRNRAQALPLTSFLCVYPYASDAGAVDQLWQALNHPATLAQLPGVAKSYGGGSIKVEPRSLEQLPIPDEVVAAHRLRAAGGHQLSLLDAEA